MDDRPPERAHLIERGGEIRDREVGQRGRVAGPATARGPRWSGRRPGSASHPPRRRDAARAGRRAARSRTAVRAPGHLRGTRPGTAADRPPPTRYARRPQPPVRARSPSRAPRQAQGWWVISVPFRTPAEGSPNWSRQLVARRGRPRRHEPGSGARGLGDPTRSADYPPGVGCRACRGRPVGGDDHARAASGDRGETANAALTRWLRNRCAAARRARAPPGASSSSPGRRSDHARSVGDCGSAA